LGTGFAVNAVNNPTLTKEMKPKIMTTLHLRKSIARLPWRCGIYLIAVALARSALLPTAQAQLSPPPDGGYPGDNTAEGDSALFSLTTGTSNTATGKQALFSNTTGGANTATGASALFSNTGGFDNTATGVGSLQSNTTGGANTATGASVLFSNTTGSNNTATGGGALISNTTGGGNTATGLNALLSNTTGSSNTANGFEALLNNTTGGANTANGFVALNFNTTGSSNTANGVSALFHNTSGSNNTANGVSALGINTSGSSNTANGVGALQNNNPGSNNTANGFDALFNNTMGNNNTAEGFQALLHTTGSNNIAMGSNAGLNLTTGGNNIDIGNSGVAGETGKIRIGTVGTQTATFVAGIDGVTVASGVGVVVGSNGQLGTVVSSERFKDQVKPMDKASEAILALKPVTFRYKREFDPDGIPQFGLVAEDVEKVNPDLVARDAQGKPYTVRYEAVNAMLLNEFLKEHSKVQELEANAARQQIQIEALTAGLQKVSAQLEASKPAPQVVTNP
jgi:hypothetical protein